MDNSYGFAELHEQLLIIMDDIDRVCRKHGIKYTLSDGTLLGAIRHKGFIPWDDDMDVRMLRGEFEKFKEVYEKEKREDFIIGHPCNLVTYSVINPRYSIPNVSTPDGRTINPWISIFPMDEAPANEKKAKMKATKMRILSGMIGLPPHYVLFSKKAKIMWRLTSAFGKIYGPKKAMEKYQRLCIEYNGQDTGVLVSYATNSKDAYYIYPDYLFKTVSDIKFEDRVYMGIDKYHEYLTIMYTNTYGYDYMIPVPPERRKAKHISS